MRLKRLLLLPAIQFVLPTGIRFGFFFPFVKENPSCICVRLDDLTSEVSHYASHSCLIETLIFVGFFLSMRVIQKENSITFCILDFHTCGCLESGGAVFLLIFLLVCSKVLLLKKLPWVYHWL